MPVSRYRGDLVRVRIGGTELDEGLWNRDDPMGGVRAVFSYRTNFGTAEAPGTPPEATSKTHSFNTCPHPPHSRTCYSSAFNIVVLPDQPPPERRLAVVDMAGPSTSCVPGSPFGIRVRLHNPEAVPSVPYRARIARLDRRTHAIVGEGWRSQTQPPLAAGCDVRRPPRDAHAAAGPALADGERRDGGRSGHGDRPRVDHCVQPVRLAGACPPASDARRALVHVIGVEVLPFLVRQPEVPADL